MFWILLCAGVVLVLLALGLVGLTAFRAVKALGASVGSASRLVEQQSDALVVHQPSSRRTAS